MSSKQRNPLNDAVNYLVTADSKLRIKGNEALHKSLEVIERTATSLGLSPDQILQLVDVAASGKQGETVSKKLIKLLIPATKVPETAVLKAISWICTNRPSMTIQCLLIRWIIVVYDYIDRRDRLHGLYGLLFRFLHFHSLLPYMCQLLYFLTRREDVKLYRVRQLLELQKNLGQQPYLTGLLLIYKHYQPGLLSVVINRNYKSLFPTYDRKWGAMVRLIQEKSNPLERSQNDTVLERLQPKLDTSYMAAASKRRKLDCIPDIHSNASRADFAKGGFSKLNLLNGTVVPFVHISTFGKLLESIDKIEFPNQMGAVLKSRLLQHVISYSSDKVAVTRFQFWLQATLHEVLLDYPLENGNEYTARLLRLLKSFQDFLQEGIPVLDAVLSSYICQWNGLDNRCLILKLLARCRLHQFSYFRESILNPLGKLFFSSAVYFKCQTIQALTDMLQNQVAVERLHHEELVSYQTQSDINTTKSKPMSVLFWEEEGEEDFKTVDFVREFIQFVSQLCLVALQCGRSHPLLEHCILNFLEMASFLHKCYQVPFVVFPPASLCVRLLFSTNPYTVSRLCSVISRFKCVFQSLKMQQNTGQLEGRRNESFESVTEVNKTILCLINALWRCKAFDHSEEARQMEELSFSPELVDQRIGVDCGEMLSIYHHQAFSCFTYKFIKENTLGIKHPTEIKVCKREFLGYLERHNLKGLNEFVSSVIIRSKPSTTK
ncbi:hypothetical protein CHS0354_023383 [Potamilus streckersoni]|uniref:Centromere protein I n=1 Tax=Potamilus streckersoni TaxID=2493646 RepID=A0AAE0W7B4_9BIVA|nr:hypothetical protein CHS0354_023383 [Potamilus streckersoni]